MIKMAHFSILNPIFIYWLWIHLLFLLLFLSLSDSMSLQVTRTLLSILADSSTDFQFFVWSQNHKSIDASHSRGLVLVCAYNSLVIWSNFNLLHNSMWITFPTQSCITLYTFCAIWLLLLLLLLLLFLESFSPERLSDNKSSQVSQTFLSILINFNNVVVWMVSTRPLISKSSSSCTNHLVTLLRAPIKIHTPVTFMFNSFCFQFSGKVDVFVSLFVFFQFYSVVSWKSKVNNSTSSLFLVDYYYYYLLRESFSHHF